MECGLRTPVHDIAPTTEPPFDALALKANLAGFAFNGVLMGIYGPMLSAVAVRFNVSLATAGLLLGIHFLGALMGAACFWRLLADSTAERSDVVGAACGCCCAA